MERCPQCTWEIQDGWCETCGYAVMDEGSIYSDDDSLGDHIYGLTDDYIDDEIFGEHYPEDDRDLYNQVENHRNEIDEAAARIGVRNATRRAERLSTQPQRPLLPLSGAYEPRRRSPYSNGGMEEEEGDSETEQYDSELDDAGSLDDFIDDDIRGRLQSLTDSVVSFRH